MKVPSDPAQVIVNHLSFRVQLARPPRTSRHYAGGADTAQLPTVKSAAKRRAPLVWSGRTGPDDSASTQLLQAVRDNGTAVPPAHGQRRRGRRRHPGPAPHRRRRRPTHHRHRPRGPAEDAHPGDRLLQGVRPARGAYDDDPDDPEYDAYDDHDLEDDEDDTADRRGDSVRHAYYPGRRMNLGVVLLPPRIFLGLISIYAGMGKLCDPVYFDGGKRGSMVAWLTQLHPWSAAAPLRDLALAHPVGAGLTVAFLQVVVGILTIFGLWQRLAASIGALLSAVLIVTVSWHSVPVYEAPDFIYLAAWSPWSSPAPPSTASTADSPAKPGDASAPAPNCGPCAAASCAAERSWRPSSSASPHHRLHARRRRPLLPGRPGPRNPHPARQQPPRLPAPAAALLLHPRGSHGPAVAGTPKPSASTHKAPIPGATPPHPPAPPVPRRHRRHGTVQQRHGQRPPRPQTPPGARGPAAQLLGLVDGQLHGRRHRRRLGRLVRGSSGGSSGGGALGGLLG
ncbi:DoxX family protein [Streptomyces griseocarneus]|uniref:DoxX family protein n=1 Tax=Streptomyces griseocarneus TaxID=51201 RepID=UPI001F60CAC5|nr:DoxX family protein [Streptomyces griseocarneus]